MKIAVVGSRFFGAAAFEALRKESGLNPRHLSGLMLAPLFVEPPSGRPIQPALAETFPKKVSQR